MVKKTAILAFVLILVSCGQKNKTTEEAVETPPVETAIIADSHNARNSLDYTGVYKGILPCGDCEGIETEVTLDAENNFVKKTKYLGKDSSIFEENGSYAWNEAGNTVVLEGITDSPNQYFVGENQLFQLDMDGNRITGELADKYILKKE